MDYLNLYNNLCSKKHIDDDNYYEWHHIIPRCMGGSDDKSNLVKLTLREHYIAHMLLYKIYKTRPLFDAYFFMSHRNINGNTIRISSRQSEKLKIQRRNTPITEKHRENIKAGRKK